MNKTSVLVYEILTIEKGENPTHMLTWNPTSNSYLSDSARFTSFLVLMMIVSPYLCGGLGLVQV